MKRFEKNEWIRKLMKNDEKIRKLLKMKVHERSKL